MIPLPPDPQLQMKAFAHARAQLTSEDAESVVKEAGQVIAEQVDEMVKLLMEEGYRVFKKQGQRSEWAAFVEQTQPVDIQLILQKNAWDLMHDETGKMVPSMMPISPWWQIWVACGETMFTGWQRKFRAAYKRNMSRLGIEVMVDEPDLTEDDYAAV